MNSAKSIFFLCGLIATPTLGWNYSEGNNKRIQSNPLISSLTTSPVINYQNTSHKVNKFRLGKSNLGWFGGGAVGAYIVDAFTGEEGWIGSEFPRGSQLSHIATGEISIGAITNG